MCCRGGCCDYGKTQKKIKNNAESGAVTMCLQLLFYAIRYVPENTLKISLFVDIMRCVIYNISCMFNKLSVLRFGIRARNF